MNLSWVEWALYLQRFQFENSKIERMEENQWAQTRVLWATLCNIHRDPKRRPTPFQPHELIKLSFDKDEKEGLGSMSVDDVLDFMK